MFLKKEQGVVLHLYVVGYHTCQKLKERAKAVNNFVLPSALKKKKKREEGERGYT